jgi:outer membrane receptor protein involved in Fe transport
MHQRARRLAALVSIFLAVAAALAQTAHRFSGAVLTPDGRPAAHISVAIRQGTAVRNTETDANGRFSVDLPQSAPAHMSIDAPAFRPVAAALLPDSPRQIRLALRPASSRIVVTADRTPLAIDQSANAVQVLSSHQLRRTATPALGDQLRQVTGLQYFRRSSTLIANPTIQGVSLRGLGSTAASRSLVLANGVPVADPFGGWVYWDQIPQLAIEDVEVVDGGVSSLYGSSAIGGVINILEREPARAMYALDAGGGQEGTRSFSGIASGTHGPWGALAAGDWLRTDGYIEIPVPYRGPVDTAANVNYQNGEIYVRRKFGSTGAAFLRGNLLNEARNNGTPLQKNGTRLWRYAGGGSWTNPMAGALSLQLFGSQEHYRQSFSAVPLNQSSETLTRLQHVATQQFGGSAQWARLVRPHLTAVAGADLDDIRASDDETPILHDLPNGLADTTARQRDIGEYAELVYAQSPWTISGSMRLDTFLNLDAVQYNQTGAAPVARTSIANRSETIFSPRLGVVRRLNRTVALTASAYRAFRSPTMNELYRRGQVGQEITLANPQLRSERATGWETGAEFVLPASTVVRASYFWTEVNRPVIALTLSTTPSEILNQRENLGQIRSRGVSLQYQAQPLHWLQVTGGYQYAKATVTQFAQEPELVGKWIPQVPHETATAQVRAVSSRWGTASLLGTESGRQFDDDRNVYLLHGYFQLDGYLSHPIGRRFEVYGAMENIFNRSIEVGKTPVLTLGTPRLATFGIRLHSLP